MAINRFAYIDQESIDPIELELMRNAYLEEPAALAAASPPPPPPPPGDYNWDAQLGATIGGVSDIYTIAVRTLSGTQTAIGSMSYWDLT